MGYFIINWRHISCSQFLIMTFRPFYLLIIFLSISISCTEEDDVVTDDDNTSSATPWNRRSFIAATDIGNVSILGTQQSFSTNEDMTWAICDTDLPSGGFNTFTMRIAIPSHPDPDFQAGAINPSMDLLYRDASGQQQSEPVYVAGSSRFEQRINSPDGDGQLSVFAFDGNLNGNMTVASFLGLTLDYNISYLDDSREEIYSEPRTAAVLVEVCN